MLAQMPARKCDITRRADVTEKVIIALALSLMVCTGFHHLDAVKAVAVMLTGPVGCASQPAFVVGVEAKIASDDDLLPVRAPRTTTRSTTTQSSPPAIK